LDKGLEESLESGNRSSTGKKTEYSKSKTDLGGKRLSGINQPPEKLETLMKKIVTSGRKTEK